MKNFERNLEKISQWNPKRITEQNLERMPDCMSKKFLGEY